MGNIGELAVVTGAFGNTGSRIASLLLKNGGRVRTLTAHTPNHDPFDGAVEVSPFNFDNPVALTKDLEGARAVFSTYWTRFGRGALSFDRAVQNLKTLIDAARRAGVRRFVHLSITGAAPDSRLPYFRGKGRVEKYLQESGLSYAIIRPALIFGQLDILLNNIAWCLRRFPFFAIPGDGEYRVQPVFADDVAELALGAAERLESLTLDAVGPEIYTFNDLVRLLARITDRPARIIHTPPTLALSLASAISLFVGDVVISRDEVFGLLDDLLVSRDAPTAPTRLSEWLQHNSADLGARYASELARRT